MTWTAPRGCPLKSFLAVVPPIELEQPAKAKAANTARLRISPISPKMVSLTRSTLDSKGEAQVTRAGNVSRCFQPIPKPTLASVPPAGGVLPVASPRIYLTTTGRGLGSALTYPPVRAGGFSCAPRLARREPRRIG